MFICLFPVGFLESHVAGDTRRREASLLGWQCQDYRAYERPALLINMHPLSLGWWDNKQAEAITLTG